MATKRKVKAKAKPKKTSSYQSLFISHKNLTWLLPLFAVGVLVFLYVLMTSK